MADEGNNVNVSSLNIKLNANDNASAKITELTTALRALQGISNVSENLRNVTSSLTDFVKATANIQGLGKSFHDIASGIREIESASKSGFQPSGIQKTVSSMSQLNSVMDEYRKRYEQISGNKAGIFVERDIENAKKAFESLGDVNVLKGFHESIGKISSESVIRDIIRIPQSIQEGYSTVGTFGEQIASQFQTSIPILQETSEAYEHLLATMIRYRNEEDAFDGFKGRDMFGYITKNLSDADKEVLEITDDFRTFERYLHGFNANELISYSNTYGLDSGDFRGLIAGENGEHLDEEYKRTQEYRANYAQLKKEQIEFFNALQEQGAQYKSEFLETTLQQLEAVVDKFPQAQQYIDTIKKDLVDITDTEQQQSTAQPFDGLANSLRSLNEIAKSIETDTAKNIQDFSNGLSSIANIKNIEFPEDIDSKIKNIVESTNAITPEVGKRLMDFGKGIESLNNIGNISIGESQWESIATFITGISSINPEFAENLEKIAKSLNSFASIKGFEVPDNFADNIQSIGTAISGLSGVDIKSVSNFGRAMNGLSRIKDFKIPPNAVSDLESLVSTVNLIPEQPIGLTMFATSIAQIARVNDIDFGHLDAQIAKIPSIMERLSTIDMTRFTEQVLELSSALAPLAQQLKVLQDGMSAVQGNVRISIGTSTKKSKTTKKEDSGKKDASATESDTDVKKLATSIQTLKNATETLGKLSEGIGNASSAFETLKNIGKPAIDSINESLTSLESAHPYIMIAVQALRLLLEVAKLVANVMKKEFQQTMELIRPVVDAVKNKVIELGNAIKQLPKKGLSAAVDGFKSLGKAVGDRFTAPFKNAAKTVTTFINGLKRIAYYRFIRSILKEISDGFKTGVDNLYQYSKLMGTDFAGSMDQVATSLQYLKNSLGAMSAPLINVLAPAIDYIIDKFVALINVIGKVIAVLTGKSVYTQAKKDATEYAEAAGGASKATQKFLLGIDEINKIDDPSGGGGGGGADYSDMFEEVEIGDEFDWVRDIKDAIDNGDWQGAGKLLAEHLNDVVDSWDAKGWGKALAEKINHGLEFAYGFLKNFDFVNLGKKVAEFIGGFNDELNWDLLGRTIAAGYNGLFDFVYGFATNLPWKSIGTNIGTAINSFVDELNVVRAAEAINAFVTGLFDLINAAITTIKWENIGAKLSEFLNNIDWYGIFTGVFTAIANGLNALKDLINGFLLGNGETGGFDWENTAIQIRTAISEAWTKVEWAELGKSLGNLIKTGFSFAAEVLSDTEFWYQLGKDIASFFINMDWPGIFMGLSKVLVNAINSAIAAITGMTEEFKEHAHEIAMGIADSITYFVDNANTDDLAKAINDFISVAIREAGNIIDKLRDDGTLEKIGQKIISFFDNLDLGGMYSDFDDLIGQFLKAKLEDVDWLEVMSSIGGNIMDGIAEGVRRKYEELGFWGIIGQFLEKMYNGILERFGIHSPSTVMKEEVGYNLIEGLKEGISEKWESIVDFFSDAWENLKTSVSEGWEGIKETILDKLGPIGDFISGIWGDSTKKSKKELDNYEKNVDKTFTSSAKTVQLQMNEVNRISNENWQSVLASTSSTLSQVESNATTTFGAVFTSADTNFSQISKSADTNFGALSKTVDTELGNAAKNGSNRANELKDSTEKTFSEMNKNLDTTCKEIAKNTDTEFNNAKTNAVNRSSETNTETGQKWDEIKQTIDGKCVDIKNTADTRFGEVNDAISKQYDQANTDAKSKWETIKSTLSSAWQGIKDAASSAFEGFGTWISNKISSINSDMYKSGQEAINSYQKGVSSAKTTVTVSTNYTEHSSRNGNTKKYASGTKNAAKGWAWVGEEGPELVNFSGGETVFTARESARMAQSANKMMEYLEPSDRAVQKAYASISNTMKNVAKSIEDSVPLIQDAFKDISSVIEESVTNIMPQDLSMPVHMEADMSEYRDAASYDMEASEIQRVYEMDRNVQYEMSEKMYNRMQQSNDNMVNVVYAAAQQIINAINENGGDIYIDGNEIGRRTTDIQNRHNRMYGKTLQNV